MKVIRTLVVVFVTLFLSSSAMALQVLPVNVDQLANADVSFAGKCVGAQTMTIQPEGFDGELLVTEYRFEVTDSIKGDLGKEFIFKQFGATKEAADRLGFPHVYGIPQYQIGKDYILLLSEETSLGLRAPIGLGHGSFVTLLAPDGQPKVVNGYGNRNLFGGIVPSKSMSKVLSTAGLSKPPERGPIDRDAFINILKGLQRGDEK